MSAEDESPGSVTGLLLRWRGGDEQALAMLMPSVYDELLRLARIQMRGERFSARARVLTDSEKDEVWDKFRKLIPQLNVYEKRTDRNIRVVRLSRVRSETA